tara:strand:+ start:2416 stop:4626 length:2211 start_codon:yes stop_codon:yes gene_type:complete
MIFRLKNLAVLALVACTFSCDFFKPSGLPEVANMKLFSNRNLEGNELVYQVSLDNAFYQGVKAPSDDDQNGKSFHFSFELENQTNQDQQFYYRIYYQNESYKVVEKNPTLNSYNTASSENFYGSWSSYTTEFKKTDLVGKGELKTILDSFQIVGNPRNEVKYYGVDVKDQRISEAVIEERIKSIYSHKEWLESVKEKAKNYNRELKEQVFIDALWTLDNQMDPEPNQIFEQLNQKQIIREEILNNAEWSSSLEVKAKENGISFEAQLTEDVNWVYADRNPGKPNYVNNRKKRNPRMGEYKFMLVVLSEQDYQSLPAYIKDMSLVDSSHQTFMNPFYYFENRYSERPMHHYFNETLKLKSVFRGDNGVYMDPLTLKNPDYDKSYFDEKFGSSESLFKTAHYEQYFHVIDKSFELRNVPIIEDVVNTPYTKEEYYTNKEKYPLAERSIKYTSISKSPGKTVYYDENEKAIKIINPGNQNIADAEKQNVGVKTRVGLAYGKFTGKIKFSKMMNKDNIWNGITSAFWLFSEKMEPWNARNICEEEGYLPKSERKPSTNKFPTSMYSEIDIEIVKESKYWPKTSYGGKEQPIDHPEENNNLIVTCTNWDMTCQDPKDFNQGVKSINYNGQEFGLHRWDYWYHALTSKFEKPHDETVGDVFYYQIEWKPTEIIWRIGPSKDEMQVVGYMSEDNTKIPNNQMITIVTQEFHYSDWWPLAPFDQNNIPFPKNDLVGYVYEVEVE